MKMIILTINLLCLSSCVFFPDSYFIRIWNDGVRPSAKEMEMFSQCLDEFQRKYSKIEDPHKVKEMQYTKDCMKKKGYW
ncbi:hypothetical protein [Glaesserella sp.]|uniref:hypothetical protein n=1 Tax=Glaesserella sp. TaxID=2094731 RepID=UPI00359F4D59